MNCIIPFTKNIDFKTNLGEISSISLEHDYSHNESVILGNFIVFGSYKTHELSVNTEEFSFTLPFDVSIQEKLDEKTVELKIDNFTYEIIKPNTLKVDIDYIIKGKEVIEERKEIFEEEPINIKEIILDDLESINELNTMKANRNISQDIEVQQEKIINETSKDSILSFAQNNEDTFITYKVHSIKEEENLETICKIYGKTEAEIQSYNLETNYTLGEKILIAEDE